ncbi:MAG: TPM domain-containing protein [Pseudomonadota bacterium]
MKKIEEAVRKAELKTSGEIVPIIYDKCSNTSFVFPLLFLVLFFFWHSVQDSFFPVNYWEGNLFLQLGLPPILTGFIAYALSRSRFVQRLLVPRSRREKVIQDRAELEFYRCGISNTQGRTGILLFVSLMERYSVVLADKAINDKLPPETWKEVLEILNSQMNEKDLEKGFVPAIEKCGELLANHFPRDPKDTNELPNYPILRQDYQ